MRLLVIWILSFGILAACDLGSNSKQGTKQVLSSGEDFKIIGNMSNGFLNDSLIYFDNNSIRFKQIWEKGKLIDTYYNDEGNYRKLKYVVERLDSQTVMPYHTDLENSSLRFYPYDDHIVKFYDSIKKSSVDRIIKNEKTKVEIYNIPNELIKLGVAGGNASMENGEYYMTPTKESGDSVKVYLIVEGLGMPSEYEAFKIE